ncbi:MAG: hypothetical protein P1V51_05040 [Deltaproteobacteria bacterium]|nr:hypothetical protein [Deltaproteobacteria bacterium]
MTHIKHLAFLLAATLAVLAAAPAHAEEVSEEDSVKKGRFVVRGNAAVDINRTINLGGTNTGGTPIGGRGNVGFGYFMVNNLSLDLDLDLRFQFSPDAGIDQLGLTPGLRYYPIPQIYVRAGVPIVFLPQFDAGVLAGVGYRQKLVRNTYFVLGVDYTYWITGDVNDSRSQKSQAPNGRLDIHAGVQAHF